MSASMPETGAQSPQQWEPKVAPSLVNLLAAFLRLGATAFGGPAMVAYIRELAPRLVRREWRLVLVAVILVGNNPASEIYVRGKVKSCEELGIYSEKHTPPASISTGELLDPTGGREDLVARALRAPGDPASIPYPVWIVFFALLFTMLNMRGIQATARTNIILTFTMLAVVEPLMPRIAIEPTGVMACSQAMNDGGA